MLNKPKFGLHKKITFLLLLGSLFLALNIIQGCCNTCSKNCKENYTKEQKAIIKTIEEAYIKGVHIERDTELMKKGFHTSFKMFALKDNQVKITDSEGWLATIKNWKEKVPEINTKVEYKFPIIDVTENAAIVRIELYKDDKHVFTDYMSLYKFEDSWKIVAKTYYRHPK